MNQKGIQSLPEVTAMKANTPLRSQTLSTHPGEHVAKGLRVEANGWKSEKMKNIVSLEGLYLACIFRENAAFSIIFMNHEAVAPEMLSV